ncbi:hypothetical protein C8J56DRAFT_1029339 [Mycena floridula]|nr:hypothetical protein C8J56DRAFT_1029339 [Mycena floridula]
MAMGNMVSSSCRVCTRHTDITLQSCDGVNFGAHTEFLACYSEAFPGMSPGLKESQHEIVRLTERSAVLELMLQFMHPQCPPDCSSLKFELLEELAEAAEKYQIYSAVAMCKMYMSVAIAKNPLRVMAYAAKHNHIDVLNDASPFSIDIPVATAFKILKGCDPVLYSAWTLYKDQWHTKGMLGRIQAALSPNSMYMCTPCRQRFSRVLSAIHLHIGHNRWSPIIYRQVMNLVSGTDCEIAGGYCGEQMTRGVEKVIAEATPMAKFIKQVEEA